MSCKLDCKNLIESSRRVIKAAKWFPLQLFMQLNTLQAIIRLSFMNLANYRGSILKRPSKNT